MKRIMLLIIALVVAAAVAATLLLFLPARQAKPMACDLYVKAIPDLDKDFALGMDVSSVIALEKAGVKYYDHDGKERDLFAILAENGVNYIRVRVWNDPFDKDGNGYGGGNCDINTAVEIGQRATKQGMKLLVDFHYSDFWADPAKQMLPKAWQGKRTSAKVGLLKEYTLDCLNQLKAAKVEVGMVRSSSESSAWHSTRHFTFICNAGSLQQTAAAWWAECHAREHNDIAGGILSLAKQVQQLLAAEGWIAGFHTIDHGGDSKDRVHKHSSNI